MIANKNAKPIMVWVYIGIPGIKHLMANMESVIKPTQIKYKWNNGSVSKRALLEGDLTVVVELCLLLSFELFDAAFVITVLKLLML